MNQIMSLFLWDKLNNNIDTKELLDSSDYSPLWNRVFGNKMKSQQQCDMLMNPLKEIYNVDRIFIGHTPQVETGISNTCNKRIWLADYGASKHLTNLTNFSYKAKKDQMLEKHKYLKYYEMVKKLIY